MLSVYCQTVNTPEVAESCILAPPEFFSFLTHVRIQSWVPPIMPGIPHVALSPAFPGTGTSTLPTLALLPNHAPATPPALGSPATPSCMDVSNPNIVPNIRTDMEGRKFRIRTLFYAAVLPPKTTTGQEIFCPYQFRGHLFSDCHRNSTQYVIPAADLATLLTFVKSNIVVPDVHYNKPEA